MLACAKLPRERINSSASRKKGLILGRLRPFQFPQKGHLNWNDNNSKEIMAYFWQFSFCIHKNIQVFIWKTITVSIFTDHWGEIKKKPSTLIISKLRLARPERAKYLLVGSRRIVHQFTCFCMENHLWEFQPKRTHICWDMNENINKENKKNSGFGEALQ